MTFSVIIPAKNELKNLQKVLPQFREPAKRFKLEIIIGDGASTDGSIEYARSFGAAVEVKTKKERETIGEGRNRGAAVATGDILVFLDAGVVLEKPLVFFETIAKRFQDTTVVAATANVDIYPEERNWQDAIVHAGVNSLIRFMNAIGQGAGKGECQIIRHSAFKKRGGYNEKLVAAEDNDMFRRLAKIGKVVFLKELHVFDDPRRYRTLGYSRVISNWLLNQCPVMFFKRLYDKEWKRVD